MDGLTRIKIKEQHTKSLYVDVICRDNGFICNCANGTRRHEILKKYFVTSIYNSEHLWEKDGRLWFFDGWVTENLSNCLEWNELWLVDVTDLVNESEVL